MAPWHHLQLLLRILLLMSSSLALGDPTPLPAEQAFTVHCQQHQTQHYQCHIHPANSDYQVHLDTIKILSPDALPADNWHVDTDKAGDTHIDITSSTPIDTITLTFQGCLNDRICYPPAPRRVNITNASSHALWRGLGFLGTGVLLALTPCVWPLFPLLLSVIARNSQVPAWRLSGAYVLGVSTAYALLGAAAHYLGHSAQLLIQSPWVLALSAALLIVLAYQQWGYWQIIRPSQTLYRYQNHCLNNRYRTASSFLVGFLGALILSPCVSGPVLAALAWSSHYHLLDSILAMSALGIGLSLPLMLVTYLNPARFQQCPKYTQYFNPIIGGILLFIGLMLLTRLPWFPVLSWPLLMIITIVITAVHTLTQAFKYALVGWLILFSALAGLYFTQPALQDMPSTPSLVSETVTTPTIIIFHADWCEQCHRLKRVVFDDLSVQDALSTFQIQRIDLTQYSKEKAAIMHHYAVMAPPHVVILMPGKTPTHLVGFFSKNTLLSTVASVANVNPDPIE